MIFCKVSAIYINLHKTQTSLKPKKDPEQKIPDPSCLREDSPAIFSLHNADLGTLFP